MGCFLIGDLIDRSCCEHEFGESGVVVMRLAPDSVRNILYVWIGPARHLYIFLFGYVMQALSTLEKDITQRTCFLGTQKDKLLGLRLQNGNNIRQQRLGAPNSLWIVVKHDCHLNAQNTLPHHHMPHCRVDVLRVGKARLYHVSVGKLLRLGALASDLARDGHLSPLSSRLHDEAEHAVAGAAHCQSAEKLVLERLGLGLGAQAAVADTLGKDFHAALGEVESLLNNRRHLADALTLLAKHVLRAGGLDDDLRALGGDLHLETSIPILGELTRKQLTREMKGTDPGGGRLE